MRDICHSSTFGVAETTLRNKGTEKGDQRIGLLNKRYLFCKDWMAPLCVVFITYTLFAFTNLCA